MPVSNNSAMDLLPARQARELGAGLEDERGGERIGMQLTSLHASVQGEGFLRGGGVVALRVGLQQGVVVEHVGVRDLVEEEARVAEVDLDGGAREEGGGERWEVEEGGAEEAGVDLEDSGL